MNEIFTFESNGDTHDWLTRADAARREFYAADASQQTESAIWKHIAQKYRVTPDLDEFNLQWEREHPQDLFSVPKAEEDLYFYLVQKAVKENSSDFLILKNAWTNFYATYAEKAGSIENLWCLFWGDISVGQWSRTKGLNHIKRGKRDKKEQIRTLVEKFGMEKFSTYGQIIRDIKFMKEITSIHEKIVTVVNPRSY